MAHTTDVPRTADTGAHRARWAAIAALVGSVAILLLTTPDSVPAPAYWAVSSVALATALVVLVAGERAWDRMVASARAAGVVSR
jgi:hypothetical protein